MLKTRLAAVTGVLLALSGCAYGGQSLVLSTAEIDTDRVPAQGANRPCRVEWSFHDWSSSLRDHTQPIRPWACGIDVQITNAGRIAQGPNQGQDDIRLQMYHKLSSGGGYDLCLFNLYPLPSRFATIRYQHVPNETGPGGVDTCEAWDVDGKRFHFSTKPYATASGNNTPGAGLTGTGQGLANAYFRMSTRTVPTGSRPPVTADMGDLLEWKFDGNLRDSSPRNAHGSNRNGGISYVATPGQDLVVASVRTSDAPAWSDWIALRAGHPNTLDCSQSYSQADQSADVACSWAVASGPTMPTFSSTTVQKPTLEGLAFGGYHINLAVRDATGKVVNQQFSIGAVNYDDQGRVIPDNPRVTDLFGPMIAFGQNPWGYADERAKRAVELQYEYFTKTGLNPPSWATPAQGTVSYPFAGIGASPGPAGTTLATDLASIATVIEVADAAKLPSLKTLPTWLVVGNAWRQQEIVRICTASATTGPARLTACFDGRGISSIYGKPQSNAQPWPRGTIVGEYRVVGTGTRFITDPERPLCPGGAPGPAGPVLYDQGTVQISSSGSVVGNGVTWTDTNVPAETGMIRIEATHGGGQPFVYWSKVVARSSAQRLEVLRPFPADIDPGPFAYKLIGYRFLSMEFIAPDGKRHNGVQFTAGCESETAAFAIAFADVSGISKNRMSDMHFSTKDSLGAKSGFGPNFYGSGLSARAFYLRSGWELAKVTADIMDDYWARDPEIAGGWYGGIPLTLGGGVVGAVANLVTNPDTKLTWDDVRPFMNIGRTVLPMTCDYIDTRDSGYFGAWLTLGALFDPQPTQWQSSLNALSEREKRCQRDDHSWANGFIFNGTGPALTLTPGSSRAAGTGLPPDLCFGIARGSATVTRGSSRFTGSGLVNGTKIVLSGTRDGRPFVGSYEFKQTGGTSGIIGVEWPGDSGVVNFIIENSLYVSTIGINTSDPNLHHNWACTWVSPSEIQLNRPWDGAPLTNARIYSNYPSGYGQQPFMLGIKIGGFYWGQRNSDPVLAETFRDLAIDAATWIREVGFDPATKGMYYGRIFEACEPALPPTAEPKFDHRTPGCSYGLTNAGVRAARTLNAETSQAIRTYFEANPTNERREWGDLVYGAVWGYCPYTKPGFYCDPQYVVDENSDYSLSGTKWPGFFFGMGMAHQWPAARLGGGTTTPRGGGGVTTTPEPGGGRRR
jgi:hypothetical protein